METTSGTSRRSMRHGMLGSPKGISLKTQGRLVRRADPGADCNVETVNQGWTDFNEFSLNGATLFRV